jgi:hypothetical protein
VEIFVPLSVVENRFFHDVHGASAQWGHKQNGVVWCRRLVVKGNLKCVIESWIFGWTMGIGNCDFERR